MSKFTFVCQEEPMPFSDSVTSKRTVEFNADALFDVITEFENFLRGCGFAFRGQLDFVDNHSNSFDYGEEPPEWHTEDFDTPQQKEFDFSVFPQNNWPFGNLKPQNMNEK